MADAVAIYKRVMGKYAKGSQGNILDDCDKTILAACIIAEAIANSAGPGEEFNQAIFEAQGGVKPLKDYEQSPAPLNT